MLRKSPGKYISSTIPYLSKKNPHISGPCANLSCSRVNCTLQEHSDFSLDYLLPLSVSLQYPPPPSKNYFQFPKSAFAFRGNGLSTTLYQLTPTLHLKDTSSNLCCLAAPLFHLFVQFMLHSTCSLPLVRAPRITAVRDFLCPGKFLRAGSHLCP